jgi:hypothetical protein
MHNSPTYIYQHNNHHQLCFSLKFALSNTYIHTINKPQFNKSPSIHQVKITKGIIISIINKYHAKEIRSFHKAQLAQRQEIHRTMITNTFNAKLIIDHLY